MTREDYVEVCKGRFGEKYGEVEANDVLENYLRPFTEVIEQFLPINETVDKFANRLKEMGYDGEFVSNKISKEECCGNCRSFEYENTEGVGICDLHEDTRDCDDWCDNHVKDWEND